jgi:misacylated tRNA(Ala) deacylase
VTDLAYLPEISDAYVRSFRARVVSLPPGGVVLDRTYFYPTGGGQPSDQGTLALPDGGAIDVVDVTRSGTSVVHRVRGPSAVVRRLAVGTEIEGTIDWDRRFRHMRLHTAQHFLSARVFARSGLRTRRATLSSDRAVLDLDGPLAADSVAPLEDDLRSAVESPRSVSVRLIPRSEWEANPAKGRSGLVPLPAQVDPVRVIEIDGVDLCPCGGTHLRSTGEMGAVALEAPTPLPTGGSRLGLALGAAARSARVTP